MDGFGGKIIFETLDRAVGTLHGSRMVGRCLGHSGTFWDILAHAQACSGDLFRGLGHAGATGVGFAGFGVEPNG